MELPLPRGWIELEDHLVDDHGLNAKEVNIMDSDWMRKVHRQVHAAGQFDFDRKHTHTV